MARRRNASTRILHTIVLPTLGVLATACEHNPFVADQPQQVPPPPPVNQYPVGQTVPLPGVPVVGSYIPAPGVAPRPPGVAIPPPGMIAPPPPPPGVAMPIPGAASPGLVPRPPGVRAVGRIAPPVGSRRPPVLGRAPSHPLDEEFKLTTEPAEPTSETRAASRRLARMNPGDERDPGCAGAGSIRRRGPA